MQATPGLAKSLCLRAKRIIGESTEWGAQARQPLRRPPEDSVPPRCYRCAGRPSSCRAWP